MLRRMPGAEEAEAPAEEERPEEEEEAAQDDGARARTRVAG
jgi:hypothetical protein